MSNERVLRAQIFIAVFWTVLLLCLPSSAQADGYVPPGERAESDIVWVPHEGGTYTLLLHKEHLTTLYFDTAAVSAILSNDQLFESKREHDAIMIRPRSHVRPGTTSSLTIITRGSMRLALRLMVVDEATDSHIQRHFKREPRSSRVAYYARPVTARGCSPKPIEFVDLVLRLAAQAGVGNYR